MTKRTVMIALATVSTLLVACVAVWPVFAQEPSPDEAALQSLDEYLEAFNARDDAAWAATLNYPHVRIAGGEVRVWQTADEYVEYMDFDRFIEQTGWHHSVWDEKKVIQSSKDKVHVAVRFTRFDADGKAFATYDSMYVMTNDNGHWGTLARSSFAP